jgi:hypothetical protein
MLIIIIATQGWDPVTGFGSVNYAKLYSYYLDIPDPTQQPTPAPTLRPSARPSAKPTPRPSASPTVPPTRAPTYLPTAALPTHTNIAFNILQQLSSTATAAEANNDPTAFQSLYEILLQIFESIDIRSVDILRFVDSPTRRLTSTAIDAHLQAGLLYVNYTLNFAVSDLSPSTNLLASLKNNVTNELSDSITTGEFSTLLSSSSSPTIASSTATTVPIVPSGTLTTVEGKKSGSSSGGISTTIIIIIAVVVGFFGVVLIGTICYCLMAKKSPAPVTSRPANAAVNQPVTTEPHRSPPHQLGVTKVVAHEVI